MHDVFEIAFRDCIFTEKLVAFIAEYLNINIDCVVSQTEYWSEAMEGRERVGISIQSSDIGLKTNMSGISSNPFSELELAEMAIVAAKTFDVEVVVGDYRKSGLQAQGSFLSYFPDGSIWESVDASHGQVSDVKNLHPI